MALPLGPSLLVVTVTAETIRLRQAGEVRALEKTASDIIPSVRRYISIIDVITPLNTSSSFPRPGKY